ncbi:MAG: AAA family ATPase [Eubacteriales bacterium]|nr:AAA family ATPase [Eubacteriales bacterium]
MKDIQELEEERRKLSCGLKKEKEESSSFFSEKKTEENSPSPSPLLKVYSSYIEGERKKAREELKNYRLRIAYEEMFLFVDREKASKESINGERVSNERTRKHVLAIQAIEKEIEEKRKILPDFDYVLKEEKLSQDIYNERHHRLVEVPYVEEAKKEIEFSLENAIPVFLVGHLGSGKTELAKEAASDFLFKRNLNQALANEMESWYKKNPKADKEKCFSHFFRVYSSIYDKVSQMDTRPYFIAGSRNLTAEDMFSEKTLKLTRAVDGKDELEELNALIERYTKWLKDNKERLEKLPQDEKIDLMTATWKTFSSLAISSSSAFGTTVEKIDKEVLKAMKEGRPVIIDELNTIAMSNLIALNDVLQQKPGTTAYVTGVGPVTIQPGFALIGTGNLSTGSVSYEGTNTLNPAFKSRFTTIVYDYAPQSITGSLKEQSHPENNELFRLLIDHLLDEEGNLTLPGGSKTVNRIFALAELGKASENLFEGKAEHTPDGDVPTLNESVLSIRNLFHVLDRYNHGEEEDLSMALWKGFLSSVTDADDRNLLLSLALRYGFFPKEEGWSVEARAKGEGIQDYEDIRKVPYGYPFEKAETLSKEEVIYLLFGEGPKRTSLPLELEKEIELSSYDDKTREEAESLEERITDLEKGEALLSSLQDADKKEE